MKNNNVGKINVLRMTILSVSGIGLFMAHCGDVFSATGCSLASGRSVLKWDINPGAILVQRDLAVGATITEITLNSAQYGQKLLDCDPSATHSYLMERAAAPGYSGYFDTGVPGVAMQVVSAGGVLFNNPATTWQSGTSDVFINASYKIKYIKTGNITSGDLTTGEIFKWSVPTPMGSGSGVLDVAIGNISGGRITQVACSVMTVSRDVALGSILVTKFTGIGHTEGEQPFKIELNCDAGANVNVTMSGRQNQGTSDTSVLGINNTGAAGVAAGLGVQILYNNQPLHIDTRMELKAADGGAEFFPFTARYYQTQNVVTVGDANATATITLTYQ